MIGRTILHYKILAKRPSMGLRTGGGMSSYREKYNNLIPHAGGVAFTP